MDVQRALRVAVSWVLGFALVLAGAPLGTPCAAGAAAADCGSCCCAAGAGTSCCGGGSETSCGCDHGQPPPPPSGVPGGEQRVEFAPADEPQPKIAAAVKQRPVVRRPPGHGLRPYHAGALHVELSVFLI